MLVEMHKRHSGPHRIYEPDPEIVRQFSALGTWEQLCELYGWVMRDGGAGAYSGGVARVVYFVALGLNRIHRINEAERVAALATVRRAVQRSAA
jgi:hypothetical protein